MKELELDQLLFFALARMYPNKSDSEIVTMLGWAKRRLSNFKKGK